MSRGAVRAVFAVPGNIETPTGGYAYARRLIAAGREAGLLLDHWPLPEGFPETSLALLAETERRLSLAPEGWPVLIDGLACGALPPDLIARLPGPVIALCHHPLGLETGLRDDRAARLLEGEAAALEACAGVVTTSRATADLLVERLGVRRAAITVAPPGTDPAEPAHGSGGSAVEILSVGSLTPRKGHDLLIDALAPLAHLDWHLTIAGAGDRDPAFAAALEARIAAAGLGDRVTLMGPVGEAELDALYDRADLFALASRYEGFGMVFAEAMARHLPVLGPDLPAVAEATRGAAHLVAPDDAAALSDALVPLLSDPAARARLSAASASAAGKLPRWADTARCVAGAIAAAAEPRDLATA